MPGSPRRITARCSASVMCRLSQTKRRRLREQGQQIGAADALEGVGEAARRRFPALHQGGIGKHRGHRVVGREQGAVAVDDVGAVPAVDRAGLRRACRSRCRRAGAPGRPRAAPAPAWPGRTRRRPGAGAAGRGADPARRPGASGRAPGRLAVFAGDLGHGPGSVSRSGGLSRSGISTPDGSRAFSARRSSSRSARRGTSVIRTIWPGWAGCNSR